MAPYGPHRAPPVDLVTNDDVVACIPINRYYRCNMLLDLGWYWYRWYLRLFGWWFLRLISRLKLICCEKKIIPWLISYAIKMHISIHLAICMYSLLVPEVHTAYRSMHFHGNGCNRKQGACAYRLQKEGVHKYCTFHTLRVKTNTTNKCRDSSSSSVFCMYLFLSFHDLYLYWNNVKGIGRSMNEKQERLARGLVIKIMSSS
jgi:hypothetical protein